jgi:hypothetical protein
MLLDWMRHAQKYGKEANGLILRKELIQLKDLIKESIRVYTPLGWRWRESPKTWTTPEGAVLTFAYLESDQDAEKYQGWNLTWIGVEELTTFARPEPLFRLMATLRSPNPDLMVCFRATANPGGPGTTWVKRRYIDTAPLGYKIITDPETGLQRCFIPARATDNKYISSDYLERIKLAAPNEGVLRGWLYGDWNIAEGAFFDEFDTAKHVIPQFKIPDDWPRFMAFDPGSSDPAAALWAAVVPEAYDRDFVGSDSKGMGQGRRVRLPREALVVYRELYIAKE